MSDAMEEANPDYRPKVIEEFPTFSVGVLEATSARSKELWMELAAVFRKHHIVPDVQRNIDDHVETDKDREDVYDAFPVLMHGGEIVKIVYRVLPVGMESYAKKEPKEVGGDDE